MNHNECLQTIQSFQCKLWRGHNLSLCIILPTYSSYTKTLDYQFTCLFLLSTSFNMFNLGYYSNYLHDKIQCNINSNIKLFVKKNYNPKFLFCNLIKNSVELQVCYIWMIPRKYRYIFWLYNNHDNKFKQQCSFCIGGIDVTENYCSIQYFTVLYYECSRILDIVDLYVLYHIMVISTHCENFYIAKLGCRSFSVAQWVNLQSTD